MEQNRECNIDPHKCAPFFIFEESAKKPFQQMLLDWLDRLKNLNFNIKLKFMIQKSIPNGSLILKKHCKIIKLLEKNLEKSSEYKARQKVLRLDAKRVNW